MVPLAGMRCQRFDNFKPGQEVPKVVLSVTFFKFGVYIPLHPFLLDIFRFFDVAHLHLTPNSY